MMIKKKLKIYLATIVGALSFSSFAANAAKNEVYCVKYLGIDGVNWDWLLDENGNKETVFGQYVLDEGGFKYGLLTHNFELKGGQEKYEELKSKCRNKFGNSNFYPQPAEGSGRWYVFSVDNTPQKGLTIYYTYLLTTLNESIKISKYNF